MAEAAGAAAPAAPSTSPTPAGPAAAPASGAPALDAATSPADGAAADARAPRLAKPLKPIPSLPGVFSDEDPFPPPPSRTAATSDPTQSGAPGPARGPDGRFLPTSSGVDGAGEHALEAAAGDDAPTKPPTPPAKFRVGDIEFDSEQHAAQNFKSLRGQFRPLQGLARELGGIDKIAPRFQDAARSAREWRAEHDRVKAELDAVRSGASPAAETPAATTAPDADGESIDWGLYAEIERLAVDGGEPWKAKQWLHEQQEKVIQARIQRMLDERLAPVAEAERAQQVAAQTETLFDSLSGYTNADGSAAFPELGDENAAYEIGRTWASLGLPPEHALTPQGAVAAIAIYRMAKARSQARTAGSPPSAPLPPRMPAAPLPTDASSAAALDGGRPPARGIAPDGAPSSEAQQILAGLRQANSGSRSMLGFDA